MRTMENPVHIAAYKGFGIIPTPMAFPEVFTALQQGTVDGQENPLSVIIAAKFDQVQKHLSLTGHVYSPCIFVMNKAAFDKLSAADKQAFLEAAKEGTKANRARVDEDDAKGVADLRAKGMKVIDNVDKAKFVAALAPVYADFEKQFGKANIDKHPQRQVSAAQPRRARPRSATSGRSQRAFAWTSSMKDAFLRIERLTSGCRMAGACAMLVVAARAGHVPDRHALRARAAGRVDRGPDPPVS